MACSKLKDPFLRIHILSRPKRHLHKRAQIAKSIRIRFRNLNFHHSRCHRPFQNSQRIDIFQNQPIQKNIDTAQIYQTRQIAKIVNILQLDTDEVDVDAGHYLPAGEERGVEDLGDGLDEFRLGEIQGFELKVLEVDEEEEWRAEVD